MIRREWIRKIFHPNRTIFFVIIDKKPNRVKQRSKRSTHPQYDFIA